MRMSSHKAASCNCIVYTCRKWTNAARWSICNMSFYARSGVVHRTIHTCLKFDRCCVSVDLSYMYLSAKRDWVLYCTHMLQIDRCCAQVDLLVVCWRTNKNCAPTLSTRVANQQTLRVGRFAKRAWRTVVHGRSTDQSHHKTHVANLPKRSVDLRHACEVL